MTKKQIITTFYWMALIAIAVYFMYAKGWVLADFESISPQAANELLQKDTKITLIDVRTPKEFLEGHIQGATSIPLQVLNETIVQLKSVKENKIIVYCHSGTRSIAASRILVKNGFIPLNVTGGISAWKASGLSVVH